MTRETVAAARCPVCGTYTPGWGHGCTTAEAQAVNVEARGEDVDAAALRQRAEQAERERDELRQFVEPLDEEVSDADR